MKKLVLFAIFFTMAFLFVSCESSKTTKITCVNTTGELASVCFDNTQKCILNPKSTCSFSLIGKEINYPYNVEISIYYDSGVKTCIFESQKFSNLVDYKITIASQNCSIQGIGK